MGNVKRTTTLLFGRSVMNAVKMTLDGMTHSILHTVQRTAVTSARTSNSYALWVRVAYRIVY